MKLFRGIVLSLLLHVGINTLHGQTSKLWTLAECVNYALQNNISLQRINLEKRTANEDVLQSKEAYLPTLSAQSTHGMVYSPFKNSGQATVANGYVETSVDKVYYNGSYGINANWTVWDGSRRKNNLKLSEIAQEQAELDSAVTARSIEEQITQYYVQILYNKEAINICKQSLELSQLNESRGRTMVEVGKMSKADLAQLTAQRATDEYNLVAAESNVTDYLFKLKQLLELTEENDFDIVTPETTDAQALAPIPTLQSVYASALDHRPEIKNALLAIESSKLNLEVARAGSLPTVSLSGGLGTNTTSLSDKAWGTQLKSNLDASVSASVSIPILDNRQTKTAVNKAMIQREAAMLDLKEKQKDLYSTVESYWISAVTNQNKFRAAQITTQSEMASYELLSEQFRLGLKNIVELMTGKTNLVNAQENELQSKYLTLLNLYMLKYYQE